MDNTYIAKILWVDDEIELLKPHILFLNEKGYDVITAVGGEDALEMLSEEKADIVFLDEHMPGLSGLEVLEKIKEKDPSIPVVMITKSEAENIMNEAIGSDIADYLIKPVNPHQILLSLKKNLEDKKLKSEKITSAYQQQFRNIGMQLSGNLDFTEWIDIYRALVSWELRLERSQDQGMYEVLKTQKEEANALFARYIEKEYKGWLNGNTMQRPVQIHTLFKDSILPLLKKTDKSYFLIVIDNLRYDQWKIFENITNRYFYTETDEIVFSILPSCTQFARNAFFAGLLPSEIEKRFPKFWVNENEEKNKNQYEEQLLLEQLKRLGYREKISYHKILNLNAGKRLVENMHNLFTNKLNVIVYNFVDMLSHARTDMEVIKELADDESAYRSLTRSWFEHSALLEVLKIIAEKKSPVIITTDHGSIKVQRPTKIIGDKNITTNLRYKQGKNMQYHNKDVFEVKNPNDIFLPRLFVSASYVFAKNDYFFAYPNNYNHYVHYFKNTFQHGGISMEELMIPFVTLQPK